MTEIPNHAEMTKAEALDFVKSPHGKNLRYCMQFYDDIDVVKKAMTNDPDVLLIASERLRSDKGLIRYGLQRIKSMKDNSINFIEFIPKEVFKDKEFLLSIIPELNSHKDMCHLLYGRMSQNGIVEGLLKNPWNPQWDNPDNPIYTSDKYLTGIYTRSLVEFFSMKDGVRNDQKDSKNLILKVERETKESPDFYLKEFYKVEEASMDKSKRVQLIEHILTKIPAEELSTVCSGHPIINEMISKKRLLDIQQVNIKTPIKKARKHFGLS